MRLKTTVTMAAVALALGVTSGAQAGTLEDVQARGVLRCVVSTGIAGFAKPDANGVWGGFDIDFCRATAAAVLGDANAIEAVTSTGKTRFTKLNAGEGDVLWRNTTITFSRDVGVKLRFHGVNYYDGQGFMVKKSLGIGSALELDGASVCIQTGTTTELNLADYFASNGMSYEAVTIEPTMKRARTTKAIVAMYTRQMLRACLQPARRCRTQMHTWCFLRSSQKSPWAPQPDMAMTSGRTSSRGS